MAIGRGSEILLYFLYFSVSSWYHCTKTTNLLLMRIISWNVNGIRATNNK
ncbi:MAG: hypothetical protein WAW59_08415 [Patescibacteria group bacterium]